MSPKGRISAWWTPINLYACRLDDTRSAREKSQNAKRLVAIPNDKFKFLLSCSLLLF